MNKDNEFNEMAELLKVLGHPVRLRIVAGLCSHENNVKSIWGSLNLPQATVSQHLSLLQHKGVIKGKRDGAEVYYSVISPFAKKVIVTLSEEKTTGIAARMKQSAIKTTKRELIRSIQEAEGNIPCFRTGKTAECGEAACLWRNECK